MTYRSLPKALSLALVMAAASFGPLLVSGTALADAPQGAATESASPKADAPAAESKPKHASKGKHKAKKGATAKAHTKTASHAKSDKSDKSEKSDKVEKTEKSPAKPSKVKRTAARENKPSAKRAKAPAKSDDSPQPTGARGKSPCASTAVTMDRGGVESEKVTLVDCQGKVQDSAIAKVSTLARPWGSPRRPASKTKRVDPAILERIDAVAKKFPGRTITLVGAPATTGSGSSAHQAGRAVDLRVDGVDNQKVVELCRTLADTGCGFYPNASFVHIDARAPGTGKASWIDASEPGEPPRYVTSWPPALPAPKAEAPAAAPAEPAAPPVAKTESTTK
ncbi:MAG: DUF882 domain-containing protein [Polyangiaceae bacterium]